MNPQLKQRTILLLLIAVGLITMASPAVCTDAVTDWNAIASATIVAKAAQPPPVSALSFAMVQGAVYDAVNAIDGGHQPYLLVQTTASPTDSKAAAAATAAFRVLSTLFPLQQSTLQAIYDAYLAGVPDDPPGSKAAGILVGEEAAAAMLNARQGDGRFGPAPDLYPEAPGIWRPTPPNFAYDPAPWVGNVRPFIVPNAAMLRSDGPNPLASAAYAEDFNEIKSVGSLTSTTRTPDQTDSAIFWQAHLHAFFNGVMRNLSAQRGLDIVTNARLFAMTNLAAADAAIGCWNDKYYWQFWRPITAIREADTDSNPATEPEPAWLPLFDPLTPVASPPPLVTPPFPDHPSGHACGTSAFVNELQSFFGTDKIAFTACSNKSGTCRSFDRLSYALKEVIGARVWAGIHFRTACVQGAVLGKRVVQWLDMHYFQPVR
jgi:hypothetical protein